MPLESFQFQSIGDVDDGSVALAMNQAIKGAYHDCEDRPELGKPRKITLEISVTPRMDRGEFVQALVAMNIKTAFPAKGIEVVMKPDGTSLKFQPSVSDNPNQEPLPFRDDE